MNNQDWNPKSWKHKATLQQPTYENASLLQEVETNLQKSAPLVTIHEIQNLKRDIKTAMNNEAFVLQAGDCAEVFRETSENTIQKYHTLMCFMSIVMSDISNKPIVRIGRVAGQYAKPRSSDMEAQDGVSLPSYRGDMVNNIEFTEQDRAHDPRKMMLAYNNACQKMNMLRMMPGHRFLAVENVIDRYQQAFSMPKGDSEINSVISHIKRSLRFMRACGVNVEHCKEFNDATLYTSHEGLILNYEEAMTRKVDNEYYNLGAHMLWIGDRTRGIDGGHVEYMRGIGNPIGIKVGPGTIPDELCQVILTMNPHNEYGKIVLISRMGSDTVQEKLLPIIAAIKRNNLNVLWMCDPMHGNTISVNGFKTRKLNQIVSEIRNCFDVCTSAGVVLGGVHLELTASDSTECLGGDQNISAHDLENRYFTHCDPRLNASQSMEIAMEIAKLI